MNESIIYRIGKFYIYCNETNTSCITNKTGLEKLLKVTLLPENIPKL